MMEIKSRSDCQLVTKVFNERWPISDGQRMSIIEQLQNIVEDPESRASEVISAAKALLAADKLNQADEHAERESEQTGNRFLEVAQRLGIADGTGAVSGS